MKTPAIIASLTVVGSIAYATGSQGVVGKQTPLMPSGSQAHSMQEEIPQARMQMAGGCQPQSAQWFSVTPHHLGRCISAIPEGSSPNYSGKVGVVPLGVCDVNGDGVVEYFDSVGNVPVFYENPTTNPILLRSDSERSGDNSTLLVHTVLLSGSPSLRSALRGLYTDQNITYGWIQPSGWRDLDHDGDQDLVCVFTYNVVGYGGTIQVDIWFENIGYNNPAAPPAADLNRDGRVDGADLALLLYAWGQTQ
jgi:hypothetical protein